MFLPHSPGHPLTGTGNIEGCIGGQKTDTRLPRLGTTGRPTLIQRKKIIGVGRPLLTATMSHTTPPPPNVPGTPTEGNITGNSGTRSTVGNTRTNVRSGEHDPKTRGAGPPPGRTRPRRANEDAVHLPLRRTETGGRGGTQRDEGTEAESGAPAVQTDGTIHGHLPFPPPPGENRRRPRPLACRREKRRTPSPPHAPQRARAPARARSFLWNLGRREWRPHSGT